jgi:hypothetical protein
VLPILPGPAIEIAPLKRDFVQAFFVSLHNRSYCALDFGELSDEELSHRAGCPGSTTPPGN